MDATESQQEALALIDDDGEDGFERFRIEDRYEIFGLARELRDRHTFITLHAAGTDVTLVTNLLDVREKTQQFVFDFSSDPHRRKAFLNAERIRAVAMLDRIRIQFTLDGLSESAAENPPVAVAKAPGNILRFQRRGDFRVQPFRSEPAIVEIPVAGSCKPMRCEILDISATGVALLLSTRDTFPVDPHTVVACCKINLPEQPPFNCAIEVCYVRSDDAAKQTRAGCRFLEVPPTAARSVQQFILNVERKRRAIERRED